MCILEDPLPDAVGLGPSSNIAFMRHIFRAFGRKGAVVGSLATPGSSSDTGPNGTGIIQASHPALPDLAARHPERDVNFVPPAHETERLLRAYFSNTGLLFPFIDEGGFIETYEHVRAVGFSNVRRTWLGLFNMILAMATCTSNSDGEDASQQLEQADVYYCRARELCSAQILRGASLEIGITP